MSEERWFYDPQLSGELPQDEARHAAKALRLKPGDEITLIDGRGSFHQAELTLTDRSRCLYRITHTAGQPRLWPGRIHLAIAPTKMLDRMEWLAEKAVEMGVDELTPLLCLNSERREMKPERIERIITAAMKQSRKARRPTLHAMTPLKDFLAQGRRGHTFIAHCHDGYERKSLYRELQTISNDEETTVMIGPEGDFAPEEVSLALAAGCQPVSLGPSRLRTETAGLAAVMMMQIAKQQ